MKQERHPIASAALPLMAAALVATPLAAQETAPQSAPVEAVTPPPVVPTIAAPPAPAEQAAPQAATAAPSNLGDPNSATPINAEAAAAAEADAQQRAPARTPRVARASAPRAVAPAAAPTTPQPSTPAAPVAATPAPVPQPAPAASPVAATTDQASQATTVTQQPAGARAVWPWVAGILVVLAAVAGVLFLRRRRADRDQELWAEDDYDAAAPMTVEPVAAALPLTDAIATAEDATVVAPAAEDVDALTGSVPVGGRPWLELALRPVRAGTDADQAMVDIELTVGNAGAEPARDVRISTFMLAAPSDDMERLLIDVPDAAVAPVTLDPGEGTRVDATLAVARSSVAGEFQPIVVADARYRLPDGSEGRTSASFVIGTDAGQSVAPLPLDGTMHGDVEARLYREPQHA